MPRLDTPDKVRGKAGFGIDVVVPGMLVAVVARCPVFGGSARSWNEAAAKQVPGVKHVVRISSGVAVVADGYWPAHQGREALAVVWDEGPNAALDSATIRAQLAALGARPGVVARKEGNPATRGVRQVAAVYEAPYLAHACMEPMNATAHVQADRCTVWAPTQFQFGNAFGKLGAQDEVARLCGLDPAKVTIHTTLLGGGFGRRFFNDFITDAVETSKAVSAPVKVIWTREDDIQHDYYRPAARASFRAQLGANGMPVSLSSHIVCTSINLSLGAPKDKLDENSVDAVMNLPYDIPNLSVAAVNAAFAVPLGFWRSVGASQNGFMVESFIDELAWAAGTDPVEYRRLLLAKKPRHLAVLNRAAEMGSWWSPLPMGVGRGVALVESFSSYVAEVAEVSLNPDRTVRVNRVAAAVDCGTVVNPDIVKAQVESAIVYGLTAALYGEITVQKGRVVQSNFHDYPLLRMSEMPAVEVSLVPSREPPTGIGEPGTPPIAAAVANAIYALTRQRIRQLPLRAVPA
jgi:isoquinoline 1-oxidoreductase beta subunit